MLSFNLFGARRKLVSSRFFLSEIEAPCPIAKSFTRQIAKCFSLRPRQCRLSLASGNGVDYDICAMPLLAIRACIRAAILSGLVLSPLTIFADSGLHLEAKEIGVPRRIFVTIRDSSRKAKPITAHVYFIGKAPSPGLCFIYAHSDLSVNLRGAPEASAKVDVAELKSDPTKRVPAGFVSTGVGEMDGWIVTAETNGKRFQVRASSPALLDVAQGKSHDSLDSMIADYEKRMAAPASRP
jgi:hypothetical protein